MENKPNSHLIRGFVVSQENHERTMKNQINFYHEALRNAQETKAEPKHYEQEPTQSIFSDEQKPLTQNHFTKTNQIKRETIFDIVKKGFHKLFPSLKKQNDN